MSKPNPQSLFDWKAVRAGASITITGKLETKEDFKLTNVSSIEGKNGHTVARHVNGDVILV